MKKEGKSYKIFSNSYICCLYNNKISRTHFDAFTKVTGGSGYMNYL